VARRVFRVCRIEGFGFRHRSAVFNAQIRLSSTRSAGYMGAPREQPRQPARGHRFK
jgi:hypothetical protein